MAEGRPTHEDYKLPITDVESLKNFPGVDVDQYYTMDDIVAGDTSGTTDTDSATDTDYEGERLH